MRSHDLVGHVPHLPLRSRGMSRVSSISHDGADPGHRGGPPCRGCRAPRSTRPHRGFALGRHPSGLGHGTSIFDCQRLTVGITRAVNCLATHAGRRGNPSGRPRKGRDAAGRCASGYEPSAMLLRAWMGAESAAPCAAAFARRAMHRGFTGEEVGGSTCPGETIKLQRRGPVVNRDNRPPEPQGDQSSANPPLVSGLYARMRGAVWVRFPAPP